MVSKEFTHPSWGVTALSLLLLRAGADPAGREGSRPQVDGSSSSSSILALGPPSALLNGLSAGAAIRLKKKKKNNSKEEGRKRGRERKPHSSVPTRPHLL